MPDPTLIPVILQEPFKPLKGELPDGISPSPPVVRGSSLADRPTSPPFEQPSEIMSEDLTISVPDPSPNSSLSQAIPVSPTVSATRSHKKAQLNLSPSVLKEVAQSVQAGVQQVFRNVTGKKPKRATIVIQRPAPSPPVAEEFVGEVDELDLLNNSVEPPPEVMEELVEPIAFTGTGAVAAGEPASELIPDKDEEDPEFEDLPTP
ncbi:MAG: hypothetical protein SFW36_16475, partial [Leptolyngbyaceae cyanobacterium bins.59]|nr:hypothetical protein [Leptolyngbyaceae cyanobacterium bins.59]